MAAGFAAVFFAGAAFFAGVVFLAAALALVVEVVPVTAWMTEVSEHEVERYNSLFTFFAAPLFDGAVVFLVVVVALALAAVVFRPDAGFVVVAAFALVAAGFFSVFFSEAGLALLPEALAAAGLALGLAAVVLALLAGLF